MAELSARGSTFLALVGVALWLGAALLVVVVVAPAAFDVLPSRTLAGELIGRILPLLFLAGMLVGLLAAVLELRRAHTRLWLLRVVAAVSIAIACGMAQFGIAPRIARVRAEAVVPIDSLVAEHVLRAEFGRLHGMSVAWLAVAVLAASSLVVLAWLGLSSLNGEREIPSPILDTGEADVGSNEN